MKKILGFLGVFALVFAFIAPSYAQDEGGTIQRTSGWRFELGSGNADTTTYDVWNIGFQAKWVRLCALPSVDVDVVYIRLANEATLDTASPTAAPVSSSAAFILGVSGAVSERALPFPIEVSTGAAAPTSPTIRCETHPWRTKGLVVHNVSGTATLDAWAW